MRLLTWNINALAGSVRNFELKHGSFRGFLDTYNIDILSVQEHKLQEQGSTQKSGLTKELACVDGYESFWAFSEKKKGYSGVATWCKLSYSARTAEVDCLGTDNDDFWGEGRVVVTDHGHFVLINVYVPNAGGKPARPRLATKLDFLRLLKAKADALQEEGREVIIVGDLNVAATQKDCHHLIKHEKCYNAEELALLSALTSRYTDVWRRLHPNEDNQFTVWDEYTSARLSNEGCRIDYVLVSPGLLDKVVSCEHLYSTPPKWSDHAGVLLELKGLEETPACKPCALSSRNMKRFNDRSQRRIADMFGAKRPAAARPAGPGAAAARSAKRQALEQRQDAAAAEAEPLPAADMAPAESVPTAGDLPDAVATTGAAPSAGTIGGTDGETAAPAADGSVHPSVEAPAAEASGTGAAAAAAAADNPGRLPGGNAPANGATAVGGNSEPKGSKQRKAGPSKAMGMGSGPVQAGSIQSFFTSKPKLKYTEDKG